MKRSANLIWTVAGLVLCAAQLGAAQQPSARHGFWAALGLGYGANSMSNVPSDYKGGAATASLKLGGTPKPNLRLGGEVNVWTKDVNGVTESVGNISGAVYFYTAARSGFFVKGGVGLASFQLSQGSSTGSTSGFGFLTGLGYDLRLGGKVSLSPITNFYWGHEGDFRHAIIDFGLSVQYN